MFHDAAGYGFFILLHLPQYIQKDQKEGPTTLHLGPHSLVSAVLDHLLIALLPWLLRPRYLPPGIRKDK
jgi:hypothetical protein